MNKNELETCLSHTAGMSPYKLDNIYNVDCYQAIKKIPDKSIDLIYTDVPYEICCGGASYFTKTRPYFKDYAKICKNTQNGKRGINYSILDEFCRVCKHIYIYIWCNKTQIPHLINYFLEKKCFFDIFCWCKTNPIPLCNNLFLNDVEYCLVFREKNTKFYGNFSTKSKFYVSATNKKDKVLFEHSTIKPIEIVKNHIINSTQENDIVLDCFSGSGTTAVACKELNRHFIAFEINEEFYKKSLERLNGFSQVDKKIKEYYGQTLFEFEKN